MLNEKKLLPTIFREIFKEGFVSASSLKTIFANAFRRHNIQILKPKAALIEECHEYKVEQVVKKIVNKTVRGYNLALTI